MLRLGTLVLLFTFLFSDLTVQAQEPPTAAITVLPADGQTRGIQLRSQTVDAIIRSDGASIWADTRVWVYLYNPARAQIVLPLALPGPQLAPAPLPANLQVRLKNSPLALTFLPASEDQPPIRATTTVTVPARSAVELRINYRQALPVEDGLATFAYLLTSTASWSGRPESLRVTVRFDPPLATGQLLGYAPDAHDRAHDTLTWHWENTKATQNVGVAFIPPSWWADLAAARSAATPDAGLAAHRALAERYWRLATMTPPAFQTKGYFERFFPSAVATLQTSLAHSGDAAPTDLAATHARLAELYLFQTARLLNKDTDTYLQLAAAELTAALALRPADVSIRQEAADLHRQLLAQARARGDALAVQEHQTRLAALDTATGLPAAQTLTQAAALALAEQAVAQDDLASAAQRVTEAFGADVIVAPSGAAPRIQQALVSVSTTPTGRRIEMQVVGTAGRAGPLLAEAAQALAGVGQVEVGADRLALFLPDIDVGSLLAAQAAAAEALAGMPELALLAAALSPAQQARQIETLPFLTIERYVEAADLGPARAQWEAQAQRLEAAAAAASAGEDASHAAQLGRVQATLWIRDAAAWRALVERSRATYRVMLATQAEVRTWELFAGEARTLTAEARSWRADRLAWVAGGSALLLALMVYVVWRAMGRG